MMMPGIGGFETIDELKKINKSVKILGMSGYRSEKMMESLRLRGVTRFLEKPYSIIDLSHAISSLVKDI